eukprot:scaffold45061_cov34-Phaeocystis_antarctica.AAC.1
MSDGSRKQPMQARLSATFGGARASSAAGGAAAASVASLSAFSAASASRTSLVAAPRSGFCSRSLASSGLKPRSGSATRRPRTATRRACLECMLLHDLPPALHRLRARRVCGPALRGGIGAAGAGRRQRGAQEARAGLGLVTTDIARPRGVHCRLQEEYGGEGQHNGGGGSSGGAGGNDEPLWPEARGGHAAPRERR